MKTKILLLFVIFICAGSIYSQSFTVIPSELSQVVTLNSEVVYDFQVKNISSLPLNIYVKKQNLGMPADWSASLCFAFCFAPFLDSVNTTQFNENPLNPQEIRNISVHVFPVVNYGVSNLKLTIGNLSNPLESLDFNVKTTVEVVAVENENNIPNSFKLYQNYPNPFNPSTNIYYQLSECGFVTLEIFDILGNKINSFVNSYQNAGTYTVSFINNNLSSGIYYYKLSQNNKFITKKMILEK